MQNFTCPCGHRLINFSHHDGMFRLSTKVIKVSPDGETVIAVCRGCGADSELPLLIQHVAPRAETRARSPRVIQVVEISNKSLVRKKRADDNKDT